MVAALGAANAVAAAPMVGDVNVATLFQDEIPLHTSHSSERLPLLPTLVKYKRMLSRNGPESVVQVVRVVSRMLVVVLKGSMWRRI